MEIDKNINDKVKSTFNALNSVEEVSVSPFFKDKTMKRLFSKKEESQIFGYWFTPKLQLAALVCIVVLNAIAFSQLKETTYDNNVNEFAESYGLSTSTEIIL